MSAAALREEKNVAAHKAIEDGLLSRGILRKTPLYLADDDGDEELSTTSSVSWLPTHMLLRSPSASLASNPSGAVDKLLQRLTPLRALVSLGDPAGWFEDGEDHRHFQHHKRRRRMWQQQQQRRSRRRPLPAELLEDGLVIPRLDFHALLRKGQRPVPVGGGSQGWILRYRDNQTGHQYALKVLRPALRDKVGLSGFRQECNMLARLSHSHILRLFGVGTAPDNRPCCMLEWVETDVFRALKLKHVPRKASQVMEAWPSALRLNLLVELSSALAYLHGGSVGTPRQRFVILHRDLKPDNLGLTADGRLKLLDFGLAVAIRGAPHTTAERFQLSGKVGSIRYMSPECGRAEPYGTASDVYSFSLIAWEVLALQGRPFSHLTIALHRTTVLCGPHRPTIPSTWDKRLARLITKAWAPQPDSRPNMSKIFTKLKQIQAAAIKNHTDPLQSAAAGTKGPAVVRLFHHMVKKKRFSPPPPTSSSCPHAAARQESDDSHGTRPTNVVSPVCSVRKGFFRKKRPLSL